MNSSQCSSDHAVLLDPPVSSRRNYEASTVMDKDSLPAESLPTDMLSMSMGALERMNACSADSEIRQHMCSMLIELRSNTRVLVHLMRQHNFISMLSEQQFTSYQHAIERLGVTSVQMEEVIKASQYLDCRHDVYTS